MKSALIGINKNLSLSLAKRNIRVNAIAPGNIIMLDLKVRIKLIRIIKDKCC